jgi:hypothetical protein
MTTQSHWREKFEADALKIYTENQQDCMKLGFTSVLDLAQYRPGGASSRFELCSWGNKCNRGKACKFLHDPIAALNSLKNRFAEKHLTDAEKKLYEKIVNPIYYLLQDARKNIFRFCQNDSGDDRTEEESRDSRRSIETPPIPVRPDISYSDALTTGPELRAALEASVQEVTKANEKPVLEDVPSQSTSPVSFDSVIKYLPVGALIGITPKGEREVLQLGANVFLGDSGSFHLLASKLEKVEVSDKLLTVSIENGIMSLL